MALRVLLADESTSIKKVMQLALQDYGVEVKSVPIGLDVIEVAKSFRPDIAFIDVLLQKRSGYDVLADIKSDPELRNLPIILMWSGFMDLDEKKLSEAQPDARLEKPFEADTLREMTKRLVPRFQGSPVEQYLRFPHLPSFEEDEPRRRPDAAPQDPPPPPSEATNMHTAPKAKLPSAPPPSHSSHHDPDDPFAGLTNFTSIPTEDGDEVSQFSQLSRNFENPLETNDEPDYDDHTIAIRSANNDNTGDIMPDGIDLGDAEDGFTHVPLSALKQNKEEESLPPEGVSPKTLPSRKPQATESERQGMQSMINNALHSGELPPRSPHQESSPIPEGPKGFPQPPKTDYFEDENEVAEPTSESPSSSYHEIDVDSLDEDLQWQSSNLSKYKLDLPEVNEEYTPEAYQIDDELNEPELLRQAGEPAPAAPSVSKDEMTEIIHEEVAKATTQAVDEKFRAFINDDTQNDHLEEVIRTIAAGAVEAAVWRVVPDIAERLVREELSRLLKDIDDSVGVKRDPS